MVLVFYHGDEYRNPAPFPVFNTDSSPGGLHKPLPDTQADTGPGTFTGKEGIKNPFDIPLGDTPAPVIDADIDFTGAAILMTPYRCADSIFRAAALNGVADNVFKDRPGPLGVHEDQCIGDRVFFNNSSATEPQGDFGKRLRDV